jgi:hypothetical protein
MSEPIFWRRRAVAMGGVVGAVLIVAWAAGGFFGDQSPAVQGASGGVHESQPPSSPPPNSQSTPSSSSTTAPPPASSGPPSPPPPLSPPPDPHLPCPDQAIGLAVELGAPQYKAGQRPVLRLVVANGGQVPCTRDISRSIREILVTSQDGATRLWSSNDCYTSAKPDLRIIQPGERLTFDVKWAGRTSAPGCPSKRTTVQAGTYSVLGKLGALASRPVPFVLT